MTGATTEASRRLVGMFLLGLGVLGAVETVRINDDWSGARLMPVVVTVALLALGAAHLARAAPSAPPAAEARPRPGRVALVLACLVAYVASLSALGFPIATAALVLVLVRRLGRYSWPVVLPLAIGLALAAHVVFRTWLGMPLPAGLLAP